MAALNQPRILRTMKRDENDELNLPSYGLDNFNWFRPKGTPASRSKVSHMSSETKPPFSTLSC